MYIATIKETKENHTRFIDNSLLENIRKKDNISISALTKIIEEENQIEYEKLISKTDDYKIEDLKLYTPDFYLVYGATNFREKIFCKGIKQTNKSEFLKLQNNDKITILDYGCVYELNSGHLYLPKKDIESFSKDTKKKNQILVA